MKFFKKINSFFRCVELLTTVQQRVKPKYHVFGHVHEGYSITSDGKIIFINASTCDVRKYLNFIEFFFVFLIFKLILFI